MRAFIIASQAQGIRATADRPGSRPLSPPKHLAILVDEAKKNAKPGSLGAQAIARVEKAIQAAGEGDIVENDRVDLMLIADLAVPLTQEQEA
jgi:hypothetical protein